MPRSNKFGTFGGVFTPSILTILGVIMYMRLPMIIGEAGLWPTIGIVLIAHIISVSTGLSVSSIATDKKVRAGGTYYIISRSLGLSIGGTLGLALFVGLSFSVSLYLIGFAESFLNFWKFPVNINNIRLAGSLILLTVTIVTFISTSLAIKTQYLIMLAIGLSLISIFFGRHEFAPTEPHFFNHSSGVPLMVLFGIFFPAVTGFEAGVSMSGDLKDPKKSIPLGTIAAIATGLVVYIGLVFFYSYTVRGDVLAKDPNVLLKISLVPGLVVAGIWGATLSSALGSILAAPRILQATALDKITPGFFAKGTASANEPRNALLLTFLIAEAGILIGDLNVIARIVSIFFITTYGFLNLSAAFETATSADFRPSFRTPAWISLIGATACILVMIQLDFVALLGAIVILGLVFLSIKRKQLSLEGGDAWSSVWASLIKMGLQRLGRTQIQSRNWRPNIIMFSGGNKERPHLREMGRSLAGNLGMITGFELEVVDKSQSSRLPRRITGESGSKDIDLYKHRCPDIYTGMDEIVRLYGFRGIEPNTVFMGWTGKEERRDRVEWLLRECEASHVSAVLLNYDKERGFGENETIDIWWKGNDRNLAFAINLMRHLTSSGEWKDARIRLLAVARHKEHIEKAYQSIESTAGKYRLNAEVKVIDNSMDDLPWPDIVRKESAGSDLTVVGFSGSAETRSEEIHSEVSRLKESLGSMLLINASDQFEDILIDTDIPRGEPAGETDPDLVLPEIKLTKYGVINQEIAGIDENGQNVLEKLYAGTFVPVYEESLKFFGELGILAESLREDLEKLLKYKDLHRRNRMLVRTKNEFYYRAKKILENLLNEKLPVQKEALENGIAWYLEKLRQDVLSFPNHLTVRHERADFRVHRGDGAALRWYKRRKKILRPFAGSAIPVRVRYKSLAEYYLQGSRQIFLGELLEKFKTDLESVFPRFRPLLLSVDEQLEIIEKRVNQKKFTEKDISELEKFFSGQLSGIRSEITALKVQNRNRLFLEFRENLQRMTDAMGKIDVNRNLPSGRKVRKAVKTVRLKNSEFADAWYYDSSGYFNRVYLDVLMQSYKNRIRDKLGEFETVLLQKIEAGLLNRIREIKQKLGRTDGSLTGIQDLKLPVGPGEDRFRLLPEFEELTAEFRTIETELPEKINFSTAPVRKKQTEAEGPAEELSVPLRRITGYVLETEFIGEVNDLLGSAADSLETSLNQLRDLLSLARFNLENIPPDEEERSGQVARIRDDAMARLTREEEKITGLYRGLIPGMRKRLEESFEDLSSHRIENSLEKYTRFSIDSRSRRVTTRFRISYRNIGRMLNRKSAQLLYSRSEGILLARKLVSEVDRTSENENILDLVERASPRPEVMKALPYYYRNLFSGKSRIGDDFWVPRPREELQFEKAVRRFRAGIRGSVMVLGDRNAGKTSLCRYVAQAHFGEDRVVHVFPPPAGSVSEAGFLAGVQRSTNLGGDLKEIFETLQTGTAVVLHDLELWWQRSEDGFESIRRILDLIRRFNFKCLFVVNMNPFAYEIINRTLSLEADFISIIRCRPFVSGELKELVLRRHRSSGMKFRIRNLTEESIPEVAIARLFNRYFDLSDGNPGTVLFRWLCNIEKVSAETIQIKPPVHLDSQPVENLQDDCIVVLGELAIHKRMSYSGLESVLGIGAGPAGGIINSLVRTGILEERPERLLVINPFIEPLVRKMLVRKGYL